MIASYPFTGITPATERAHPMRSRIPHYSCLRPARRFTVCSALFVLAGVAACGSVAGQAGAGGGGGSTAGGGGSSTGGACAASGLRVTIDTAAAGAAAGSTYYPIDFTNSSGVSCRIDGYPEAWFATSAGDRIGKTAVRDRSVRAHPIALRPGATAHAWLQVIAAANYPVKTCHPVTAHLLRVRVPGAAAVISVRHSFPACAAAMPGRDILAVQPVAPGRGRRGTAG